MISYWLPFECHYLSTIARRQTGEGAPTIKMEIIQSVLSLDPGVCRCAYDLSIVLVKIVVFCTHRRNLLASTTQELRQTYREIDILMVDSPVLLPGLAKFRIWRSSCVVLVSKLRGVYEKQLF